MTTSGQRCTAAKLIPSWNVPADMPPSPMYTSPTRGSPRIRKVRAVPAALERVRGSHRFPLLAERAEQSTDDFALPVQGREPFLQGPREPQIAVDFEQLLAGEPRRDGRRLGRGNGAGRHCKL